MIIVSVEGAAMAALLLLAVERSNSGIIIVSSDELHEPQEVMQIKLLDRVDAIIPPMLMDTPLTIGYVSDHHVSKHSGLASLKLIRKRQMTLSGVRIRDGPYS